MTSLISINDLSKQQLLNFCARAAIINHNHIVPTLQGKIISTLFFEPSTRTKMSFETAAIKAGAQLLNFPMDSSSLQKGESFEDTIRMVSTYADVVVLRHPNEDALQNAKNVTNAPLINAGNGANEHPTQTLLDLYTIIEETGSIDGLTISIIGDLKYGRTVHSLVSALRHFDVKIILASPTSLSLPNEFKDQIKDQIILETDQLNQALMADFVYVTRVQKERFSQQNHLFNEEDWILTKSMIESHGTPNLKIMHPLPRVNEIHTDIDDTTHALYFKQAENGIYMRIAILEYVLGVFNAN